MLDPLSPGDKPATLPSKSIVSSLHVLHVFSFLWLKVLYSKGHSKKARRVFAPLWAPVPGTSMDGSIRRESFIGRNRTPTSVVKIGERAAAALAPNTDAAPSNDLVLSPRLEVPVISDVQLVVEREKVVEEPQGSAQDKIEIQCENSQNDNNVAEHQIKTAATRASIPEPNRTSTGRDRTSKDVTRSNEGDSYHSFHEEEKRAIVRHINSLLRNDPDLTAVVPIDPDSMGIFDYLKDGILLW